MENAKGITVGLMALAVAELVELEAGSREMLTGIWLDGADMAHAERAAAAATAARRNMETLAATACAGGRVAVAECGAVLALIGACRSELELIAAGAGGLLALAAGRCGAARGFVSSARWALGAVNV